MVKKKTEQKPQYVWYAHIYKKNVSRDESVDYFILTFFSLYSSTPLRLSVRLGRCCLSVQFDFDVVRIWFARAQFYQSDCSLFGKCTMYSNCFPFIHIENASPKTVHLLQQRKCSEFFFYYLHLFFFFQVNFWLIFERIQTIHSHTSFKTS